MSRQPVNATVFSNHAHNGNGYAWAANGFFPQGDQSYTIPGNTIFVGTVRSIVNGAVYINGVPLYLDYSQASGGAKAQPLVLPPGTVISVANTNTNANDGNVCIAHWVNGFTYDFGG